MSVGNEARIYDQGYRRYDGPRLGPRSAVFSLWRHTVQRVLGLRRSARHKVLPFLAIVMAYLPAVAFIGILALLPKDAGDRVRSIVPTYAQYYGFVTAAIVLFVVFSAPEALCPDRRNRTMSVYLASPLTRESYLLAKVLAVFSVLCLVTVGPLLLLLVGYVLQNHGPDGPVGVLSQLAHIVGAGVAVAAFETALALGLSSLTDRRGLATGGALIVLFGTHVTAGALGFGLGLGQKMLLLSLFVLPFEVGERLLGAPAAQRFFGGVPTASVLAAALAWTALFAGLVYQRYSRLQVTR